MKFAGIRQTAIKGIDAPDRHSLATPRLLSPYKDRAHLKPAEGVNPLDIARPQHNRASRRAMGMRQSTAPVSITPPSPDRTCLDCPHGWKHHKWSGRCRKGCECTNGTKRAKR